MKIIVVLVHLKEQVVPKMIQRVVAVFCIFLFLDVSTVSAQNGYFAQKKLVAQFTFTISNNIVSCRVYTIVAPKVFRPSSDFHVSISLHGNAGVTNVVVAIDGRQDGGGPVQNVQSASVDANSTQIITFKVFC